MLFGRRLVRAFRQELEAADLESHILLAVQLHAESTAKASGIIHELDRSGAVDEHLDAPALGDHDHLVPVTFAKVLGDPLRRRRGHAGAAGGFGWSWLRLPNIFPPVGRLSRRA